MAQYITKMFIRISSISVRVSAMALTLMATNSILNQNLVLADTIGHNPQIIDSEAEHNSSKNHHLLKNNLLISKNVTNNNYTGIVKKINNIAEKITVKINLSNNNNQKNNASGVIVAKRGNTYYVATARYVLCNREIHSEKCQRDGNSNPEVEIVTPDGKVYPLDYQTVELILGDDMAIFSFQSSEIYQVAEIGSYQWQNQWVFTSGFAVNDNQSARRILTAGKVFTQEKAPFVVRDASSLADMFQPLVYTNNSYAGMGGGAVLDSEGRLIGINIGVEAEFYVDEEGNYGEYNLGYSLGTSIRGLLGFLQSKNNNISLKFEWLNVENSLPDELTAKEIASIQEQLQIIKKPSQQTNITGLMNYSNQLWREGKYTEAKTILQQAISLEPDFDKAYYTLGLVALQMEDYQEAVTAFKKAIEINESPYYYWRYLGLSYKVLGEYELALTAYNQAIDKNNDNPDFVLYVERADVYNNLGEYELAIAGYTTGMEINPNNAEIYFNQGKTYYDKEEYELAIEDFTQAININPNYAEAYLYRGKVYEKLEKYDLAIADFNKAIEINPDYSGCYVCRGNIYLEMGRYELAVEDFTKAIMINPQSDEAYLYRGKVYEKLGEYDLAIADFNKAIEINPYGKAYYERGMTYREMEKYQLALADFNTVLQSAPPNFYQVYLGRGLTYLYLQEYNLAIADLSTFIEINPNWGESYLYRGIAYNELGEKNKARGDIEKAIDLFKQQDKVEEYQKAIAVLKRL